MKLEELAEARDDLVTEIKAKDERIHELEKTLNSLRTEFSDYVATVKDIHLTLADVASEFSQLQPQVPRDPHTYAPRGQSIGGELKVAPTETIGE